MRQDGAVGAMATTSERQKGAHFLPEESPEEVVQPRQVLSPRCELVKSDEDLPGG